MPRFFVLKVDFYKLYRSTACVILYAIFVIKEARSLVSTNLNSHNDKKNVTFCGIAAFAVVMGWFCYAEYKPNFQGNLLKANIEALADAEQSEIWHIDGTSTTYYKDGVPQYTVMTRDCTPGGSMPCTPATTTIWHNK